jgi:hypothetical protein
MTPEEYPPPKCPTCDRPMRLAASLPAEDGLPAVAGFRCDVCNTETTLEIED